MENHSVQNENGVLGNKLSAISEILTVHMGCAEPERIVAALNFLYDCLALMFYNKNDRDTDLDDRMDEWQVLLIVNCGQTFASDHAIKFFVRLRLNFRVGGNERREPLHNRCSLAQEDKYKIPVDEAKHTVSTPPIMKAEHKIAMSR